MGDCIVEVIQVHSVVQDLKDGAERRSTDLVEKALEEIMIRITKSTFFFYSLMKNQIPSFGFVDLERSKGDSTHDIII